MKFCPKAHTYKRTCINKETFQISLPIFVLVPMMKPINNCPMKTTTESKPSNDPKCIYV